MTAATLHPVKPEEEGMRLDRWCRLRFPGLTNAYLNKLLRTGQVRLDGARVKGNARLSAGQEVRMPPLAFPTRPRDAPPAAQPLTPKDRALLEAMILYSDDDVLVLNKPAGLAVQGGTRMARHVDGFSNPGPPSLASGRGWCTGSTATPRAFWWWRAGATWRRHWGACSPPARSRRNIGRWSRACRIRARARSTCRF